MINIHTRSHGKKDYHCIKKFDNNFCCLAYMIHNTHNMCSVYSANKHRPTCFTNTVEPVCTLNIKRTVVAFSVRNTTVTFETCPFSNNGDG